MRILHVFKTYLPDTVGGIERVIWEIAEGSAAHGDRAEVLSLSRSPNPATVTVDHHLSHRAKQDVYIASTGFSLSFVGVYRRLAAAADVLHYHHPWPFMDLVHVTTGMRKPYIVTYHSDIVRQKRLEAVYRPLMHRFLGSADAIVATSPNYVETSEVLARHKERTVVIPIGLADTAAPVNDARFGGRVPERYMLFVGALRYYKGLTFLLEAARQTGIPVVIAGRGEMEDELRASTLPNVTFLGQVNDGEKAALLRGSDAFVFPSHLRSEAFGVALLEAAMFGKAMISCEVGTGTSYINLDRATGRVIAPADAGALAAAMTAMWSDPRTTAGYGRNARARYLELFTAEKMCADYTALYRRVVETRTGSR